MWAVCIQQEAAEFAESFPEHAGIYDIGPSVNLHPSSLHRDSLFRAFVSQIFPVLLVTM